jgi:hypothetical protein
MVAIFCIDSNTVEGVGWQGSLGRYRIQIRPGDFLCGLCFCLVKVFEYGEKYAPRSP